MSFRPRNPEPKIYLDPRGVLGPHRLPAHWQEDPARSDFALERVEASDYYSPEVVERLGKLSMRLVFCTPLLGLDLFDFRRKPGLGGIQRLSFAYDFDEAGKKLAAAKFDAIYKDQVRNNPRPFVWLSANIPSGIESRAHDVFQDIPHLTVITDAAIGITRGNLAEVEAFARAHVLDTELHS